MKRTIHETRRSTRIACTIGVLAAFAGSSVANAQVGGVGAAPAVAPPAMAAPAMAPPAAVAPAAGTAPAATPANATAGGSVAPVTNSFAVPTVGQTAFGTNPAGAAAGTATGQGGSFNGATGTNATAIVPGAANNAVNANGTFAASTPGVSLPANGNAINGTVFGQVPGATTNSAGTSTTTNGVAVPPGLYGGTVVYWPYPIYLPAQGGAAAYGGGPSNGAGSGAQTPSVPGAQASESQENTEPAPPPQIDYRSIAGGRANTNLDDPAFRAAHIRRW
jgi:hypothetical protein